MFFLGSCTTFFKNSLEKNTIKKLQFAFQFIKENMQKLFFPTKQNTKRSAALLSVKFSC
jgi:preprotein translocase subunit SecE